MGDASSPCMRFNFYHRDIAKACPEPHQSGSDPLPPGLPATLVHLALREGKRLLGCATQRIRLLVRPGRVGNITCWQVK